MAWLRLTKQTGCEVLVNTDQVSEFTAYNDGTTVWCPAFSTDVRESVDEIAAMIEQAERLELVTRFAVAIVGSDYDGPGARFESDTIWRMAEQYVDARPKIGGE